MYKYTQPRMTTLKRNTSYIGERIEEKIDRIMNNGEPITDSAPLIYTDREKGVEPSYNIKTDRMECAQEVHDKAVRSNMAKRAERLEMKNAKTKLELDQKNAAAAAGGTKNEAGGQSTSTTGGGTPS